jgi:alcohol dehydrogenase (cytochrome c)
VEGRIEGDALRFSCRSADGDRTVSFVGKASDGQITLTWTLQVREGSAPLDPSDTFAPPVPGFERYHAPPQFTVKRVADGAGEVVLSRIAERVRTTRPPFSPVTFDRLLRSTDEPANWLTYSGDLLGTRHSALRDLTPANVADLELAWTFASRSNGRFEATPIVSGGVLYTVQAPNDVVALDAITGVPLWTHLYAPAAGARATGGGGRPNRGLAILGDTLFLGTLDAHLLAIDARTGTLRWNTTVADAADPACQPPNRPSRAPCYVITHAPLVARDKIIVGTGGGDGGSAGYGIRGFVAAFDAETGKEAWRFWTIPGPGEPGHETWSGESWETGGAGVWNTGTYDSTNNLTYWGIGNPVPSADGRSRVGDNLYSNSVVALDADTGRLKWHYQFTPHDEQDWDSAQVPVLADIHWQGRPRQVLLFANKNGLWYVLDRATGELLSGTPFIEINWMNGFDSKGRPILTNIAKTDVLPGSPAATNWFPASYSRETGLYYVPSFERHGEGPNQSSGAVTAVDPGTGKRRWEFRQPNAWFSSGVLTTASGLVFAGTTGDVFAGPSAARVADGYFYALDAGTGRQLWRTSLAGSAHSGPVTYRAGGTQYVAVTGGNVLFAFARRQ